EWPRADQVELLRRCDLRHQNRVRRGMHSGSDVRGEPGRVDAVDANEKLALAETARLDGLRDLRARRFLGVGSDGVLEIEDETVGGERLCLLERAQVRTGHVQHAAARTDGPGTPPDARAGPAREV